jgi:hypothetical protein
MKLQAETLIETIVASVILSLSLMMALSIINNIALTKAPSIRIKAQDAIEKQFFTTVQNKHFEANTTNFQEFIIKQTIENYSDDLKLLRIDAYKQDSLFISGTKRLIYCGNKIKSIYNN